MQAFVDTVLMDIDPELAKAIKESGKFHIVLELIADHDSILNYVSYLGLMIEAVHRTFMLTRALSTACNCCWKRS